MLRLRGVRAMEEEAAWRWLRLGIFLFLWRWEAASGVKRLTWKPEQSWWHHSVLSLATRNIKLSSLL